uniref:Uncharacterized protein n=1 Tax=viral metagenome TaxID=1070528 RepID=A0A6C0BP16_9ZZZZ
MKRKGLLQENLLTSKHLKFGQGKRCGELKARNELFTFLVPQFFDQVVKIPSTAAKETVKTIRDLLVKNPHFAHAIDSADPFEHQNTIGHYLVFFLGAYTKTCAFLTPSDEHYKMRAQVFGTILRDLVLKYDYDVFTRNKNGTSVVSYCFQRLHARHPARRLLVKIVREKVDQEKKQARQLVAHGCPFLRRCGLVPDMQREIKLLVLMDRVQSVYKLVALRELYYHAVTDLAVLLPQLAAKMGK